MRPLLISLLLLGAVSAPCQEAPSFKRDGVPFMPAKCEFAWSAPTNELPKALWIYKTIPQRFSDQAISNLVALGAFTVRDQLIITDEERAQASPNDLAMGENAQGFESENKKRSLAFLPATGYIIYIDQEADDVHCPIEDVPSEAMTQEMGLELLAQIGIPRSELATKRNSSEPLTFKEPRSRGHFDTEQHKLVKEGIDSRGVFYVRQIDGVTFAGIGVAGGFHVRFTNHAKVAQLELVWRNLHPFKKYETASADQIKQWIKEGKAVITKPDDGKVSPAEVKKLTITEISPLYAGKNGEELQDFTYPFASLDAIADTGTTNIAIQLYCPILTEEIAKP